MYIMNIT